MSLHRMIHGHQVGCRGAQSLGNGRLMKHDPFVVAVAQEHFEIKIDGGKSWNCRRRILSPIESAVLLGDRGKDSPPTTEFLDKRISSVRVLT